MFCQKGDLLQSRLTRRVFLVLSEDVNFTSGIKYQLSLLPLMPFRDLIGGPIQVSVGIEHIKHFNVNYVEPNHPSNELYLDREPWEETAVWW